MFINVTVSRHSVTKFTCEVSYGSGNKAFSEFHELLIEIIFSSFTFTNCKCSQSRFTPPLEGTAQLTNPKILMHPVYNNDVRKHCLLLSRPRGASIILYYIWHKIICGCWLHFPSGICRVAQFFIIFSGANSNTGKHLSGPLTLLIPVFAT